MTQPGDFVIFSNDSTGANAASQMVLTTQSATKCGIRIMDTGMQFYGDTISLFNPFHTSYNFMSTTLPNKSLYEVGHVLTIPFTSFTGQNWIGGTVTTPYNIMTIAWNGSGNYSLGVYIVHIVIITGYSTAPASCICWNTVSSSSSILTATSSNLSTGILFSGTVLRQLIKLDFILTVNDLTTTYFLNYWQGGGASLTANNISEISFTRLA